MNINRNMTYAETLGKMISHETVSRPGMTDRSKFYNFHGLLRELFPNVFCAGEVECFDGSLLIRIKGSGAGAPIMLMNHHDVVEAGGSWKYPPFASNIAQGKIWGRGVLDTKGGLFGMLMAMEELLRDGEVPTRDTFFLSSCTEESDGSGAKEIARILKERGIRFSLILDEGGMIVSEPIKGANGRYAMIGVGEKGSADLKFKAKSSGGHASTPGKDTPLVRLGKFMAEVDKGQLFDAKISKTVCETFTRISGGMSGPLKLLLKNTRILAPVLNKVLPEVSGAAAAMLKTTLAFTMASGSDGANVLPEEAYVIGNMRYSHHQGGEDSIREVTELAERYSITVEIIRRGEDSPVSDYSSDAFMMIERGVAEIYPDVTTVPYIMNAASDSRFMGELSDNCLRFAPFIIDNDQLASVHGVNENLDIDTLAPAVDFYKYVIKNA